MASDETTRWTVTEVHNFGGFFGGDTVTLSASRWGDDVEETITIDEKVLTNLEDRHKVAPAMVFDLLMVGDRVDRAALVGALDWPVLATAIDMHASCAPMLEPRIRAYHCAVCRLWVLGEPRKDGSGQWCRLCAELLAA